jgi:DNA transformation protein and related proteins
MAEPTEFVSNILRVLVPLGEVNVKRMFGGYGVFLDGSMFALISRNDELFLKADEVNRSTFENRGSKTHGKMPYYSAPPEALESWQEMEPWARGAVDASRRAKKKK